MMQSNWKEPTNVNEIALVLQHHNERLTILDEKLKEIELAVAPIPSIAKTLEALLRYVESNPELCVLHTPLPVVTKIQEKNSEMKKEEEGDSLQFELLIPAFFFEEREYASVVEIPAFFFAEEEVVTAKFDAINPSYFSEAYGSLKEWFVVGYKWMGKYHSTIIFGYNRNLFDRGKGTDYGYQPELWSKHSSVSFYGSSAELLVVSRLLVKMSARTRNFPFLLITGFLLCLFLNKVCEENIQGMSQEQGYWLVIGFRNPFDCFLAKDGVLSTACQVCVELLQMDSMCAVSKNVIKNPLPGENSSYDCFHLNGRISDRGKKFNFVRGLLQFVGGLVSPKLTAKSVRLLKGCLYDLWFQVAKALLLGEGTTREDTSEGLVKDPQRGSILKSFPNELDEIQAREVRDGTTSVVIRIVELLMLCILLVYGWIEYVAKIGGIQLLLLGVQLLWVCCARRGHLKWKFKFVTTHLLPRNEAVNPYSRLLVCVPQGSVSLGWTKLTKELTVAEWVRRKQVALVVGAKSAFKLSQRKEYRSHSWFMHLIVLDLAATSGTGVYGQLCIKMAEGVSLDVPNHVILWQVVVINGDGILGLGLSSLSLAFKAILQEVLRVHIERNEKIEGESIHLKEFLDLLMLIFSAQLQRGLLMEVTVLVQRSLVSVLQGDCEGCFNDHASQEGYSLSSLELLDGISGSAVNVGNHLDSILGTRLLLLVVINNLRWPFKFLSTGLFLDMPHWVASVGVFVSVNPTVRIENGWRTQFWETETGELGLLIVFERKHVKLSQPNRGYTVLLAQGTQFQKSWGVECFSGNQGPNFNIIAELRGWFQFLLYERIILLLLTVTMVYGESKVVDLLRWNFKTVSTSSGRMVISDGTVWLLNWCYGNLQSLDIRIPKQLVTNHKVKHHWNLGHAVRSFKTGVGSVVPTEETLWLGRSPMSEFWSEALRQLKHQFYITLGIARPHVREGTMVAIYKGLTEVLWGVMEIGLLLHSEFDQRKQFALVVGFISSGEIERGYTTRISMLNIGEHNSTISDNNSNGGNQCIFRIKTIASSIRMFESMIKCFISMSVRLRKGYNLVLGWDLTRVFTENDDFLWQLKGNFLAVLRGDGELYKSFYIHKGSYLHTLYYSHSGGGALRQLHHHVSVTKGLTTSALSLMYAWKIGPTLATRNTGVMKPADLTPLSALYVSIFLHEAGLLPGIVNIISGFRATVGAGIASHMDCDKTAFTGSTATGQTILEWSAKSNLKQATWGLGGRSPFIAVLRDADSSVSTTAMPQLMLKQFLHCLVRELTAQFPAATPLALVLKQFLEDRSLDHSYSGGLSATGWFY